MLFCAFPVALQVDSFLTTLAEVIFVSALGVEIIAIMIAPFVRLFRDSESNEKLQRKITRNLEEDAVKDIKEEGRFDDSVFHSDFVYEDAS
jgi:hypothetical protein